MSAQMEVTLLLDGSVVYTYTQDTGVDVIAPERIWHIKGMGNGIIGLSAMDYQRRSLGIAVGAEKATAKTYANGGKRSGVLMIDRLLTPEHRAMVRQNFNGLVEGGERLFVLEAGAKFEPVAMSPQDIELLSSRKFNVEDLARWYGVPSVMINDTGGSTVWGSGISEIVRGFYKLTLRPILEKLELSMKVTLLPVAERSEIEFEFDFEGLLRSDQKSRFDGYRVGIQGAITTPNECRAWEGLPPMEGGDVLYMQGATVPIDSLEAQTLPAIASPTAAPTEAAPQGADVQATALNGAQVTSLQEIVAAVSLGQMPSETAGAMIAAAFPLLTSEQITAMLAPLRNFEPRQQPAAAPQE
jgi:HK97 family phage portal protein